MYPEKDKSPRPAASHDATYSALLESELRLRGLVEAALEAIVTIDDRGIVLEWNAEAERTFGWSREEALGEELAALIVPEQYREAHRAALRTVGSPHESKILNRRVEISALTRGGDEIPIELTVIPLAWGRRQVYTAFVRDITAHVRAVAEARHFSAVIEASNEAIIGISAAGDIVSWNRAAEKMYGYTTMEIRGQSIAKLSPPERAWDTEEVLNKLRWGIGHESRSVGMRRDGTVFQIVRSLRPTSHGGSQRTGVLVCTDLSAHEDLERKLAREQYLASLGRLASTVSHEFNNVLMGIQPFVEVIERHTNDERLKKAAAHMRLSISRGKQITDEIRGFTRASSPPNLQPVSLPDFLAALEGQLRSLLSPNIDLQVSSTATASSLICDVAQLTQAIVNLALNAQDAMPAGGRLAISASSISDAGAEGEFVEMVVSDTGSGMDDTVIAHIFEPLFTTRQRGTGLGLAIVRQIIDRHGGSISVSSVRDHGTQFRLRLPASHERAMEVMSQASPRTFRPSRILVVDDDVAVAAGLAEGLRSYDMNVQTVGTAAQALPSVETFRPDVVVLDLDLQDGNGLDVYRKLRRTLPSLPVIFSTGHGDLLFTERDDPRATLLRKPYEIETLLIEIERLTSPSGDSR